jgi:predicted ArsR family transcriptional regulator
MRLRELGFTCADGSYPGAVTSADEGTPLDSVSVLSDRSRWRMLSFIRRSRRGVTREEAAESLGISRKLAAFHLDKLVDAGFLTSHYERSGEERKVGRRPKVYEPADTQISFSLPGRRYELLADLLLDTVLQDGEAVDTARRRGEELGAAERERRRPGRLGGERGLTLCEHMLEEHGYEPVREGPYAVRLHNCPFHPLAAKAPDLVCGMNQAFLAGYLDGLQVAGVEAVLAPEPGECCVRLSAR